MKTERMPCLHPDPGKKGTRIERWNYELLHAALLEVIPLSEEGMPFKELTARLEDVLSEENLQRVGSLMWYLVTVKLDMEARGEIERVPANHPPTYPPPLIKITKSTVPLDNLFALTKIRQVVYAGTSRFPLTPPA